VGWLAGWLTGWAGIGCDGLGWLDCLGWLCVAIFVFASDVYKKRAPIINRDYFFKNLSTYMACHLVPSPTSFLSWMTHWSIHRQSMDNVWKLFTTLPLDSTLAPLSGWGAPAPHTLFFFVVFCGGS
jgi:hypothetical protein